MNYEARAIIAARLGGSLVVLVGLLVLAGWLFNLPALTSIYLPGPNVKTTRG